MYNFSRVLDLFSLAFRLELCVCVSDTYGAYVLIL